ncbi:site-specific tyrosine recombinase XerC [Planctomycetes bacterium Poly30]|uniref:Site-specific tyrosine recombinase XerC n=1 Tax=Saltatorellus ferox TaxID=2528018 RepID=A0A518ETA0_9BACT|nr:site-specific tyrosine recombinase XerC [Planctomycetes bacterium Poly30]
MRFLDQRGKRRELFLFESKRVSEAFERRVRELLAHRQTGETLSPDMLRWISAMAPKYRKRLVAWGVIDERRVAAVGSIERLEAAWAASIEARGVTEQHLRQTTAQVRRIFEALGVETWLDIDVLEIQNELARRCRGDKGWGVARHNHHVTSLRHFGKWLTDEKLVVENTLASLSKRSRGSEMPRHPRRDGTVAEFKLLLERTRASDQSVLDMTPDLRALLYWTAALTGLRAGELGRFKVSWIHWRRDDDGEVTPGYLLPEANETKAGKQSGRRDPIVLQSDLEDALAAHCDGKAVNAKVFPSFQVSNAAAMLRADLELAEIPYVDGAGRFFDFHALRHTFITWAGRSGADPKTHQTLARHADYAQTAHYSHTRLDALSAAVEAMPHLGGRAER